MKKHNIFLLLIILSIAISPVYAKFESWMGFGFTNHKYTLDDSERINHVTMSENPADLNTINYIGPAANIALYPEYMIPIGINFTSEFLFPISYNDYEVFRSYKFDFKFREKIGITYAQSYTDIWGMFAEFGYTFDFTRSAQSNIKNENLKVDFKTYANHSLYGELGLLTTMQKGYFKVGFNYTHSIINNSMSYDMILAGGYRF